MHTKTLLCSLLLIASPAIMANPIYQPESASSSHHEATAGGVGLVAGTLIAGPFGAIIGGSLGVMAGNQQSKAETITEQQHFIAKLESDIDLITTELSQSKLHVSQLESNHQQLQNEFNQSQQTYGDDIQQFITSYQFDVYFLSNSDAIDSHAQQGLLKLAELLKNNPSIEASIEAHSDWRGSNDNNYKLARTRLDSIEKHLSLKGANSSQLLTTNYGESKNVNNGSWGEELFYDRRVTITLNFFGG
ncbi:MAG: OmpA family protein [Methylophaga sp.]|nr:OmpA family protein [Methylophaga sp.]